MSSTHTATVAPEKADTSTRSAAVSFVERQGEGEVKLTYTEQLRRPEWQKVRLQVLEAAGWKCQHCGNDESTLHVHHKRYIKGRMAWEYERSNFEALCEPCHQGSHEAKDRINLVLASIPGCMWGTAADILTAWAWDHLPEDVGAVEPHSDRIGILADLCGSLSTGEVEQIIGVAREKLAKKPSTPSGLVD